MSKQRDSFGHTGPLHQSYLLKQLLVNTRAKGIGFLSERFHFLS